MAQAKTKASAKRAPTRKRSQNAKAKSPRRPKSSARSRGSNGAARVKAARQAVESTTKDAGQTVGKVASKAKTPLLAGGAALAGAAGGMAIGAMRSRKSSHKLLGVKMPQPKRVKLRSRDMAKAAKEVGTFGQSVGELATELRHVREESGNGSGKHRSPVEVVLDGLTARR